MKEALCFDDILLVPQHSSVKSRHDVRLTMSIGYGKKEIDLFTPIIASPMDTVCDVEMCRAMSDRGGLGILHRYMSYQEQIIKSQDLIEEKYNFGVAIASNNGFLAQADNLYNIGVRIFLIDTANGHSDYAINAVRQLSSSLPDAHIMAGNVATYDGFKRLADAGADSVRVGIGGGSVCTTRIVSGHGVPTAQSVSDIAMANEYECSIIADGGIRNSGDMVKAFALGADAVMLGSMLAGTDEAPGELFESNGSLVKHFRGMASTSAQVDFTGQALISEGVSTTIPYKGSVNDIVDQIRGGLGSGCSYSGVHELADLHIYSEAIRVSPLSIGESKPHAVMV
jgi:IMP dehydrogenase